MPPANPHPWEVLSDVVGWIYFAAWSISFYPQVFTNHRRKAVTGLSFDFELLNLIGFACMTVYNAALFWNPVVREQYAERNDGNVPLVAVNDVAFALHALALTLVHLFQIATLDRGNQKFSYMSITVAVCVSLFGASFSIAIAAGRSSWYTLVNGLSYVKLAISFVKYLPQVYLNWARKSTVGWNIYNILLDFTGGTLSIAQLLIDCWLADDWGNAFKFILGLIAIGFDLIFMFQHYVLYRDRREPPVTGSLSPKDEEGRSLLADAESPSTNTPPPTSSNALWRAFKAFTAQTY